MKTKHYRSAGLLIESDFELPGLARHATGTGPAQLRYLRADEKPSAPSNPTMEGADWASDGRRFYLTVPDVAEFLIWDNGTVEVWPTSESQTNIAAFLVGSVLGIALHMRRIVTLHASAVQVGGGAVLFCGDSGAGKSTMAAALQSHGFTVLCDDLCAIELTNGEGAIAHSDGRKLKLWEDTIGALGLQAKRGARVHNQLDKFFVQGDEAAKSFLPVRAVFELAQNEGASEPKLFEMPMADAAAMIRQNAYRPFLVRHLKDEALYFEAAVVLLRQAVLLRLERHHDFDEIEKVVDIVLRQSPVAGLRHRPSALHQER
ncbi:hypothetical protein [Aestuariicoccus sp. MJ-SS9]|uniref:hypothetical protein n=1 Tax=Aestuariicoccus sp. MJ-SS9 TaxID=3079855 RepID=UPI002907D401|nr:hypothetical protein [Aestuariicoccus sp. MJ-SS9]MDU8913742.1 hypothetical protein [Aestuariicoccus sp. MJ-SS9]